MELFFRGITVPEGQWDLYYWHRLSSPFLVFLYKQFPEISWYGLMLYVALWLAASHFFIIIYRVMPGHFWVKLAACLFLFFFILLENVLTINFLRVTLLLAISNFALYLITSKDVSGQWNRFFFTLYFFAAFLFAYQIRPEGGQLVIALSLLFSVPLYWLRTDLRSPIHRLYFLMMSVVAVIYVLDWFRFTDERRFDEKRIPYLQIIHNYSSLQYSNDYDDSLKVRIAVSGFFSDRELIDESFLSEKLKHRKWYEGLTVSPTEYLKTIYHIIYVYFKNNLPLAIIGLALLVFLWQSLKKNGRRKELWILLLALSVFWIAIVLLTLTKKMPNRLLTPLLIYFLAGMLIYLHFFATEIRKFRKSAWVVLGSLCLLAVIPYSYRYHTRIEWFKNRCQRNTEKLKEIENVYSKNYFIMSKTAISLFNGLNPMKVSPLKSKNQYMIWGWYNWYSAYDRYLQQISGSSRFGEAVVYMIRNQAYMAATEDDLQLFIQHLQLSAGYSCIAEKISHSAFEELTYNQKIHIYNLK